MSITIGKLTYEEVEQCLLDISKVTPCTLDGQDEWKEFDKDSRLEITNSDYGQNRLRYVFGCGPTAYVNAIAMVEHACSRNGTKVPQWFLDKYPVA